MIYFLVNNNYHLIDVETHLDKLTGVDIGLIQVPHTLNVIERDSRYKKITIFSKLVEKKSDYFNILKNRKIEESLNESLDITHEDILFIYTEYELMNHKIIEHFYKSGAKIYIIEEGLASYIQFYGKFKTKMKIKMYIKDFLVKKIYRLKKTRVMLFNNHPFYVMEDKIFNGVCFYFDSKKEMNREIKKILIKKDIKKIPDLKKQCVIFLNEDLYNFYENFGDYSRNLNSLLEKLNCNFEKVFFKFHPREYNMPDKLEKIKLIIKKYDKIEIIDTKEPIEKIVAEIKPAYAVSYISVALLNLYFMGITPIFAYSVLDNLNSLEIFEDISDFLKNINYNILKSLSEINSNYTSNIKLGSEYKCISEILFKGR